MDYHPKDWPDALGSYENRLSFNQSSFNSIRYEHDLRWRDLIFGIPFPLLPREPFGEVSFRYNRATGEFIVPRVARWVY